MYRVPVTSLSQEGLAVKLMGASGPFRCAAQIACSVSGCAVDDLYDLALPLPGWVEVPEAPGGKARLSESVGETGRLGLLTWKCWGILDGRPHAGTWLCLCWSAETVLGAGPSLSSGSGTTPVVEHGLKGTSAWAISGAAAYSSMLVAFGRLLPRM